MIAGPAHMFSPEHLSLRRGGASRHISGWGCRRRQCSVRATGSGSGPAGPPKSRGPGRGRGVRRRESCCAQADRCGRSAEAPVVSERDSCEATGRGLRMRCLRSGPFFFMPALGPQPRTRSGVWLAAVGGPGPGGRVGGPGSGRVGACFSEEGQRYRTQHEAARRAGTQQSRCVGSASLSAHLHVASGYLRH